MNMNINELNLDNFKKYTMDDYIVEFHIYMSDDELSFHNFELEKYDVLITDRDGELQRIYRGENDGWEEFKVYRLDGDKVYSQIIIDDLCLEFDEIEMCDVESLRNRMIEKYHD